MFSHTTPAAPLSAVPSTSLIMGLLLTGVPSGWALQPSRGQPYPSSTTLQHGVDAVWLPTPLLLLPSVWSDAMVSRACQPARCAGDLCVSSCTHAQLRTGVLGSSVTCEHC